jgi:CTP:molybdopterin cytidylyltransferase MocA
MLEGETLVQRAVRVCREAGCTRVVVVEGAVRLEVSDAELVHCDDWAEGPGASLRAGARHIGDDAVLVLLVDQWRVTAEHLRQLLAAKGPVVAAHYAGALGVPVRFEPSHAHILRELSNGQGAKQWLRTQASEVTAVAMPEAEDDLDTAEQLARFQI